MNKGTSVASPLATEIVDRIGELIEQAEEKMQPLEVEPFRSRLFELFVTAEAAGHVTPGSEPDLSADGVCRELARRWNLAHAARSSMATQTRLPAQHLSKMRLLWSFMRMWMEWAYAWERWEEFHQDARDRAPSRA